MTTSPALEKAMVTKPVTLHLIPREDGGLRIKADELPGLILSNMDHAALFRDLPEVIRHLIAYGGYTPSLPSGGDVVEIRKRHERDEDRFNFATITKLREMGVKAHDDRATLLQHAASQARTIEALRAALEPFATEIHDGGTMPSEAELVWHLSDGTCINCDVVVEDFHNARRALKEHPNG